MKGRADTKEKKEQVLRRLLDAWDQVPNMRLGQLLYSAQSRAHKDPRDDYFSIEDEILTEMCEHFADEHHRRRRLLEIWERVPKLLLEELKPIAQRMPNQCHSWFYDYCESRDLAVLCDKFTQVWVESRDLAVIREKFAKVRTQWRGKYGG